MALAQQSGDGSPTTGGTKMEAVLRPTPLTKLVARKWARSVVSAATGCTPVELVEQVAAGIRHKLGHPAPEGERLELDELAPPAGGWANPWLLGLLHEYAVSEYDRKSRGAWYTPETVVRGLVALAIPGPDEPNSVADPTCGGGAFLLAALDRLVEIGTSPEKALGLVHGMDIDADAVVVSKLSIQVWALQHDVERSLNQIAVEVGDALEGFPPRWVKPMTVVGNPPFASPLRKGAIPEKAERFRSDRSETLQPYTDLAAIHLLSAIEQAGPGSTVVLVQPQSMLASRDTKALRDHIENTGSMESLWVAREAVFDAGVRVCAPVIGVGKSQGSTVALATGPDVVRTGSTDRVSWASCAARALGAPSLPSGCWSPSEVLGSLVSATAGFRDEYYGLVDACFELPVGQSHEDQSFDRLLTVGSVEPLVSLWGTQPTRLGGRDWNRPVVDRNNLDAKVLRWVERQALPKVVLATQSKVLEPVIDVDGSFAPVTPLIAVHADVEELGLIAAVLLAPPVVAWAWEHWFGSAMAVDALKLAAKQVLELPLPADRKKWEKAASLIVDGSQATLSVEQGKELATEAAAIMTDAYRASNDVLNWWLDRV